MNLSHIFDSGDPVLVAVFVLLAGMSVVSWYVILWKGCNVFKERALLKQFCQRYMTHADWPVRTPITQAAGSIQLLVQATEYANTVRADLLTLHLSQALDKVRTQLDKGLTILASIGSSAPFIGLFGTVWGIYGALMKISAEGNANLNVVAGPMGEALIATAIGLFAAIPAVLAYNAFVRLNRVVVQDLRHIAEQLTAYLSINEPVTTTKTVQGAR